MTYKWQRKGMNIDHELDQYFSIDHPGQSYEGQLHGPEALYTSYKDLIKIYSDLDFKKGVFVDLGSGNCRASLLFKCINPRIDVISIDWNYEVISKARSAGKIIGIQSSKFIHGDLNEIDIPNADAYFLYQSTDELLYRIMEKLKNHHPYKLYAIESHGDLIPKLKNDFSWLKECKVISQSSSQRYDPMIYRFSSRPFSSFSQEILNINKGMHLNFFHELLLELRWHKEYVALIEEEDHCWLASTYLVQSGLVAQTYEFRYPHRIVSAGKIKKLFKNPPELKTFIKERFEIHSKIRKIILAPHIQIEYIDRGRIHLK